MEGRIRDKNYEDYLRRKELKGRIIPPSSYVLAIKLYFRKKNAHTNKSSLKLVSNAIIEVFETLKHSNLASVRLDDSDSSIIVIGKFPINLSPMEVARHLKRRTNSLVKKLNPNATLLEKKDDGSIEIWTRGYGILNHRWAKIKGTNMLFEIPTKEDS